MLNFIQQSSSHLSSSHLLLLTSLVSSSLPSFGLLATCFLHFSPSNHCRGKHADLVFGLSFVVKHRAAQGQSFFIFLPSMPQWTTSLTAEPHSSGVLTLQPRLHVVQQLNGIQLFLFSFTLRLLPITLFALFSLSLHLLCSRGFLYILLF